MADLCSPKNAAPRREGAAAVLIHEGRLGEQSSARKRCAPRVGRGALGVFASPNVVTYEKTLGTGEGEEEGDVGRLVATQLAGHPSIYALPSLRR